MKRREFCLSEASGAAGPLPPAANHHQRCCQSIEESRTRLNRKPKTERVRSSVICGGLDGAELWCCCCDRRKREEGLLRSQLLATAFRIRIERRGDVTRPDLQRRGDIDEKLRWLDREGGGVACLQKKKEEKKRKEGKRKF
ncbi:hypothetical protein JCGZ_10853 [Jatropha curcas]|uniref:Uncharacterized protein n=1 Tax=Jatropha curcas TaxID=180498 RepID=A0A067KT56_JATCU|nr:hypothetical protein JCGZ_10853 [Jatropha curcas]